MKRDDFICFFASVLNDARIEEDEDITLNFFTVVEQTPEYRSAYDKLTDLYGKDDINKMIGKEIKKFYDLKNLQRKRTDQCGLIGSYTVHGEKDDIELDIMMSETGNRQTLSPDWKAAAEKLAANFPAAHRFVKKAEQSEDIILKTSKNAHFYRADTPLCFRLYVKIEDSGNSLKLSGKYHVKIADGASDDGETFYEKALQIVDQHATSIEFESMTDGIVISKADDAFFGDLLEAIKE
jgi:hypothetical protein